MVCSNLSYSFQLLTYYIQLGALTDDRHSKFTYSFLSLAINPVLCLSSTPNSTRLYLALITLPTKLPHYLAKNKRPITFAKPRQIINMARVEEIRQAQRASGPATILAIGTATPANCINQADYPDYYFRITKSEHMTELKEKFKRMCK